LDKIELNLKYIIKHQHLSSFDRSLAMI